MELKLANSTLHLVVPIIDCKAIVLIGTPIDVITRKTSNVHVDFNVNMPIAVM